MSKPVIIINHNNNKKTLIDTKTTSPYLQQWVPPCFQTLQSTILKLCRHVVAFDFTYTYLLWLNNKKQLDLCISKLHFNLYFVSYLQVATASLDDTAVQLQALKTLAYLQSGGYFREIPSFQNMKP